MNPRAFLALARDLVSNVNEEDLRTAVSRAYYGAFHVARDLLFGLGFQVPDADRAHGYLWLRLSNCGDSQVVTVGMRLQQLRHQRNQADYDLATTILGHLAESDVDMAMEMVQDLDSLTPGPRLTQIRDAIIVYERDVLMDVTWKP